MKFQVLSTGLLKTNNLVRSKAVSEFPKSIMVKVWNGENIFVRRYNRLTNDVNQVNQIGFFPDFGYRFQF